jgi:hypothetical protein
VSDIFADSSAGATGGGVATADADTDIHDGQGPQPGQRPISLETVVRARPVFVVGCPRAGTTHVQTILDSHPRLSVLYEADALVDIPLGLRSSQFNASEALALAEAHPNCRTHSFDIPAASAICTELGITHAAGAMRVLAASRALAQGKGRWGNKTPKAFLHLAELALVYPDAQFIHVIRDGRDAASSQARVFGCSVVHGALLWRAGVRSGRRSGSRLGPDRYLEVRLEELLVSPEEQVRRMCAFLGEDFDQSMLHSGTVARERIPPSALTFHPRLGEPPQPLPTSRDGAATGLVQRAAAALIDAELVELGYAPAASSGRRRRIVYTAIGYTLFLVSLRSRLRELFRHLARSAGARRATRSITRQPGDTQIQGGNLPRQAAAPASADAQDER